MSKFRDASPSRANRPAVSVARFVVCALCVTRLLDSSIALAGGSNYNVVPGTLSSVQGKVTEWSVPTPKFARDPAPAPDGSMYIAVMQGNKIAHFDPAT